MEGEKKKSREKRNQSEASLAQEKLEKDARDYIVRHGKMQMLARKERGLDVPNISLEEAEARIQKSDENIKKAQARLEEIRSEEKSAKRREAADEKRFMNRADESFTIEEYEEAKDQPFYGSLSENSNNPNRSSNAPYAGNIKRLKRIERALKKRGLIPALESELIGYKLDELFPKSRSNDVVEYEGKRYRSRYFPLSKSNSGKTVYAWEHFWEEVKDVDTDPIQ